MLFKKGKKRYTAWEVVDHDGLTVGELRQWSIEVKNLNREMFQCFYPYNNRILGIKSQGRTPAFETEEEALEQLWKDKQEDEKFLQYCERNRKKIGVFLDWVERNQEK